MFGFGIEVYIILLIIGVPMFFIWRRLFRKSIVAGKKRKIVTWVATILSTPIIYTAIISLFFLIGIYYPGHDFDKEKWHSDKDERYEFSENIIKSKMLIGKTKTDIKKLLGDEGNKDNDDDWFYDLGFTPGSIDPDSMEIEFKNGRVVSVMQHYHH